MNCVCLNCAIQELQQEQQKNHHNSSIGAEKPTHNSVAKQKSKSFKRLTVHTLWFVIIFFRLRHLAMIDTAWYSVRGI